MNPKKWRAMYRHYCANLFALDLRYEDVLRRAWAAPGDLYANYVQYPRRQHIIILHMFRVNKHKSKLP